MNSTGSYERSMEKFSSALGLTEPAMMLWVSIIEGLRSDIRYLDQASRNVSEGISIIQTGEGALDELSSILLRMKELAEQSMNDTMSNTDRGI